MRKRLGGQVVPPCSAHHESARVIPLGSIQAGGGGGGRWTAMQDSFGVHSTGEANVVLAARACVNTPKESCIAVHRPTTCRAVLETTSRHAIASSPVPYVHVLRVTRDRWSTRVRVCERGSEERRWCSPSTKSDPDPAAFVLFCPSPSPNKFGTIYIAKPDERFATCAFSPLLQSQTHRGENTPYLICTNQRVLEKEGGEGVLQEGKSIVTLNRPIRPISPSLPGHARCCRVETVWGALHFDATVVVAAAAAAAGVQLDAGMLKIVCISFFYSICLSIL